MSNEHNKALCPCTKAGQCAGVTAALQCRSDINVEYAKESPGYIETEVEAAKRAVLAVYPDAWHSSGIIWKYPYPSLHAVDPAYADRYPEDAAWIHAASKLPNPHPPVIDTTPEETKMGYTDLPSAKHAVLSVWEKAKEAPTGWSWIIRCYSHKDGFFGDVLGEGATPEDAWLDAAARLFHPGGELGERPKPVKLWASGGLTNYSDYLMSDGSICTMHVPTGEIVSVVWQKGSIHPKPEAASTIERDRVCAECEKWIYWDNGDVTYHCSCRAGWKWKVVDRSHVAELYRQLVTSSPHVGPALSGQTEGAEEPGTRTNPLKAEGAIAEIATRVKSGSWTTLDLEALADHVLQSQSSSLAGNEWECFRDVAYYDMYAVRPKGETRWGHCFHLNSREEAEGLCDLLNEARQSQPVIEPLVPDGILSLIAKGVLGANDENAMTMAEELQQFRKAQRELGK